jgi:sugar/nucleoside kinase (ribokinase family)
MRSTLAFVGMTTIDIVQVAEELPAPDHKGSAHRAYLDVGGPAANAAITASILGSESTLHSAFGSGSWGSLIESLFAPYRVARVGHDDREDLPVSSIWVATVTGARTLLSTAAAFAGPRHAQVDLDDARAVLLDGFYPDLARAAAREAAERNIPLVLDCGTWREVFGELLPLASIAIVSEQFELPDYGGGTPAEIAGELADRFSLDLAAVSRGGEPIAWADRSDVGELPVPRVDAVDTLGAGDVLHGAFLHFAYERNLDHLAALEAAADVASQSCRYFGTRDGVMAWANG